MLTIGRIYIHPSNKFVTCCLKCKHFLTFAICSLLSMECRLCTTLCLQYKPHYIAAGSLFLAAKLQKVKLPTEGGRVWWLEFDISVKQLEGLFIESFHIPAYSGL